MDLPAPVPAASAPDAEAMARRRRILVKDTKIMLGLKLALVISAGLTIYRAVTLQESSMVPAVLFIFMVVAFLVTDVVAGRIYARIADIDEELSWIRAKREADEAIARVAAVPEWTVTFTAYGEGDPSAAANEITALLRRHDDVLKYGWTVERSPAVMHTNFAAVMNTNLTAGGNDHESV